MQPEIDLLLATYNGERFLKSQLQSLSEQTFRNFRIVVRDDGSGDSTLQIISHFQTGYRGRLEVSVNDTRQGACRNFSLLASGSTAPYVAFCDQDDVWRANKLDISLRAIKTVENTHGTHTPVLVFTNLALIDEHGRCLSPSFWRTTRILPERLTFGSQVVQNLVTGCTILANRSLVNLATPVPEGARMHDYWFGLVATAFGIAHPIRHVTLDYRQHDGNAIGTRLGSHAERLRQLRADPAFEEYIIGSQLQARTFAARYAERLSSRQMATLNAWSNCMHYPPVIRQIMLNRYGLRRTGFLNNLGFMARI